MADTTYSTPSASTAPSTSPLTSTAEAQASSAGTGSSGLDDLRVSPAAHLAGLMSEASAAGGRRVGLRELPFTVQIGLRAQPDSASWKSLEDTFGLNLPRSVGEVTGDPAARHVLWLSPDEFLAVDVSRCQQPGETIVAEAGLEGLPGQAVDLSANRTILELTGEKAREVLEKSCRADLHPRAFGIGSAIVTALGPVPVILHHSGEDTYRIYPRASFADFTVRWLLDGMAEFLTDGQTPGAEAEGAG